ncbi:hypothetical protein ABPG77_007025 [Micractinium sp. CCAP 211/92]
MTVRPPILLQILLQVAVFGAACAAARSSGRGCSGAKKMLSETQRFLDGLAERGLLGATVAVNYKSCGFVYEEAFGYSVPELKVRMTPDVATPVGSNTKFFTAVALWQLHERGLVDIDAPVVKYMDPKDFGQKEQWCPRLHGAPAGGACVYPTARQLLNMGSGLVDVDNCAYEPNAWQRKYCISDSQTVNLIGNNPNVAMYGAPGPAAYFAAEGYWSMPLESAPGTAYRYVNANFQLAAYIIEKVSGLPYTQYLRIHIIEPAGLKATHVDMAYGADGALRRFFPGPAAGYRPVIAPVSEDYVQNVSVATTLDGQRLTRAKPGTVADLARQPAILGFLAWAGGAGAIYATPRDLIDFWHTVLFHPRKLNLTRATVREMLHATNNASAIGGIPTSTVAFAQGIIVKPNRKYKPYGVSAVLYSGGINEITSPFMLTWLDPDSGRQQDTAAVGSIFFAEPWLQVPYNSSTCVADNPWARTSSKKSFKLDKELCAVLGGGMRNYASNKLFDIWGLGSPIAPPA